MRDRVLGRRVDTFDEDGAVTRGILHQPAAESIVSRSVTAIVLVVVAATIAVLAVDAVQSIASGVYVNFASGVWLALARDTRDGVFYRPLWNGAEYGGTRYFPLMFIAMAALMRIGVTAVTAGVAVSMAGLAALALAIIAWLRRAAVPTPLVALGTALAIAPYFVHQTAFAIRPEPLAAAFSVFGLAALWPIDRRPLSSTRAWLAAALFAAAFATKMTSIYAPAAAVLALLLLRRPADAIKIAGFTVTGGALFLLITYAASDGRALESFRACALAGSDAGSLLSVAAVVRAAALIGTSHLLTAVFALTLIALVLSPGQWLRLPALYVLSALAITAIILASPGTILTGHSVDAYVAAILFLTLSVAAWQGRLRSIGCMTLVLIAAWAAAQNVVRIVAMRQEDVVRVNVVQRRELIDAVKSCRGPLLSESPVVPILADLRPAILDPFALRVVALNRPEIAAHLRHRIDTAEFACVILEHDPNTAAGRQWYQNVNLTEPVVAAVLRRYTLARTVHGQRIYVPASADAPATPGR